MIRMQGKEQEREKKRRECEKDTHQAETESAKTTRRVLSSPFTTATTPALQSPVNVDSMQVGGVGDPIR